MFLYDKIYNIIIINNNNKNNIFEAQHLKILVRKLYIFLNFFIKKII